MRRFRNIVVVPLTNRPEAPPALREAVALARTSGAELRILGHMPSPRPCETSLDLEELRQFLEASTAAHAERLAGWARDVGEPGLHIDVVSGSLPLDVATSVRDSGHDLVVIASDDSAESAAAARRILRSCPCPVWLTRPSFTGSRVLAAIDPDHGTERNQLILELASSQAELHNGALSVIHAWDLPTGAAGEGTPTGLGRSGLSTLASAVEAAHNSAFAAAMDAVSFAVPPSTHLVDGVPARAIRGLSVLYRSDLLVVGAGAWNTPELGLGSTTEQVVAESESSVLVVR